MATQKQDEKQGNGGRGQQAVAVQRGSQEQRQMARARPFAMMRRMLDDLDDLGTWARPFGATSPFGLTSSFGLTRPFSTMRRMFDDLERVLDTELPGEVEWAARDYVWAPRIEITQREDKLLVRADLPGIPQDQIKISAEGDSLVIEGERPMPSEQQEDVWCSECAHGRFRRVVAMPQGAALDKAEARYENGVLEVSVPAAATQLRGRRIEIQAGGKEEGRPNLPPEKPAAQPQAERH